MAKSCVCVSHLEYAFNGAPFIMDTFRKSPLDTVVHLEAYDLLRQVKASQLQSSAITKLVDNFSHVWNSKMTLSWY